MLKCFYPIDYLWPLNQMRGYKNCLIRVTQNVFSSGTVYVWTLYNPVHLELASLSWNLHMASYGLRSSLPFPLWGSESETQNILCVLPSGCQILSSLLLKYADIKINFITKISQTNAIPQKFVKLGLRCFCTLLCHATLPGSFKTFHLVQPMLNEWILIE
jgi:hypothetical protein